MPITWVESEHRFALVSISGPWTIQEWRATMLAAWNSPVFRQERAILIDRRAADPPSSAFVDSMTKFLAEHRALITGTRAAIVAPNDANFGMGRMTQMRSEVNVPYAEIHVFRQLEQAVAWLTE